MKRRPLAGFTTNKGVVGRDRLGAQLRDSYPVWNRKLAPALATGLSQLRRTAPIDIDVRCIRKCNCAVLHVPALHCIRLLQ